jgi:F-type H+-transporting ATPase subunit b
MELITPGIGLIFWTSIFFFVVLFLLSKYAWKPIISAVDERNHSINEALASAEKAKQEMAKLKSENEALLQEARLERDKMLREARTVADKLLADAEAKALTEGQKLLKQAQDAIATEKNAALTEVKNQIATLSLSLAEKILRNELANPAAQQALIKDYMNDLKMN